MKQTKIKALNDIKKLNPDFGNDDIAQLFLWQLPRRQSSTGWIVWKVLGVRAFLLRANGTSVDWHKMRENKKWDKRVEGKKNHSYFSDELLKNKKFEQNWWCFTARKIKGCSKLHSAAVLTKIYKMICSKVVCCLSWNIKLYPQFWVGNRFFCVCGIKHCVWVFLNGLSMTYTAELLRNKSNYLGKRNFSRFESVSASGTSILLLK